MEYPEITKVIADHYASSKDPLLLSRLGQRLKELGIWPIKGEDKPLAHILSEMQPHIELVRDSFAGSYVVVTPPEFRHIADQSIHHRGIIRYLRGLPRVVMLAFCVDGPLRSVYINSESPYDYLVDPDNIGSNYRLIDIHHRIPGLYIGNVASLPLTAAEELSQKIQSWSKSNGVDFIRPKAAREPEDQTSVMPSSISSTRRITGSALDRLFDAQKPEVALAMNIPLDIAQLLSRIP